MVFETLKKKHNLDFGDILESGKENLKFQQSFNKDFQDFVNEYFLEHDPKYYLNNINSTVYFINSLDDFCFPSDTIMPIISRQD
jgi:hypothetical protein